MPTTESTDRLITCAFAIRQETRARLIELAEEKRLNFSSFVRETLERYVARRERTETEKKRRTA